MDSRYLTPVDTALVSTCVDTRSSDTTAVKPKTTEGFGNDKGRNMPESLSNRGCKEALVRKVCSRAITTTSGTAPHLPPGEGISQASSQLDPRALRAGFSATHPVDMGKPGHGFSVPADGVREQPDSSRMQWQWQAEYHRSRSVGSTNHGPRKPTATVTATDTGT